MKYYKLNDLCTDIVDCPHTTPDWKNEGIRVVRNFNLKDGNLDFTDGYFVDEATYLERTKRAIPEEGDIIISREAPMGVVGIVPKGLKCCLGQRLVLLKVNKGKCDPYYLLNTLMSDFVQTQFKRADATGSIVSNLCIPDLKEIIIPVIESGQEDVARLLEIINKKQLINNAINDNLEQQIQLIFDYLFPDVCAGNKHMGDFIIPKRGKSLLSKNAVHGNVPVIAGGLEPSIYHNVANTIAPVVTISSSGANAGFVNIWGVPVWSSDSSYIDSEMSRYVYFLYAYLKRHQNNIYNIQTGSAQPHIYPRHISSLPITDLDYKKIENYTEIVSPIFSTITKNHVENQHLQSLRDWLLPMLMNGQATIND